MSDKSKALPLVPSDSPILRQVSAKVGTVTNEVCGIIDGMIATMEQNGGIGLAANQVGYALQIAVVKCKRIQQCTITSTPWRLPIPLVFINPIISARRKETSKMSEGCLSFPGVNVEVERPVAIHVEALGRNGKPFTLDCHGMLARVIQHEADHLNGVLIIDKAITQ